MTSINITKNKVYNDAVLQHTHTHKSKALMGIRFFLITLEVPQVSPVVKCMVVVFFNITDSHLY